VGQGFSLAADSESTPKGVPHVVTESNPSAPNNNPSAPNSNPSALNNNLSAPNSNPSAPNRSVVAKLLA
jgi:hypothetical protein